MMKYKGYLAFVGYNKDTRRYTIEVVNIRNKAITAQSFEAKGITGAFKGAVDTYLARCNARKKEPLRPLGAGDDDEFWYQYACYNRGYSPHDYDKESIHILEEEV